MNDNQIKNYISGDQTSVGDVTDSEAVAVGTAALAIKGDVIFQIFTEAAISLSQHIRVQEFQSLVNERTKEFVGREFIFAAINDSLKDREFLSGYIVISGEPGIGKTAMMAQLIKQNGAVHHFNIAPQNIRSPQDFLANVCAQLIVRYKLDYPALPPEATKDSGFLSRLLEEVASKEQPILILVDALDEAEDTGLPSSANRLYLPRTLPKGIFFIVTSREEHDYRLDVDRRKDIYLRDDDPRNLDDVRQYIRNYVQEHRTEMATKIEQWSVNEDDFVAVITEQSEGNFMYLVYVLRDIRDGKLNSSNVDNIHNLPKGLRDYYQRHWRSMKEQDKERFEMYYEPVVCQLATVREPVSIAQLVEWTKLKPMRIKEVIQVWREFLNEFSLEEAQPLYRIYHASFQDFLKDEVGLTNYHNKIVQTAFDKIQW